VLTALAGSRPQVDPDARRLTVPVTAGAVTLPELVRRLDAAGVEAEDVTIRRPTLDEVFLAQTGVTAGREAGAAA
jgi:ABC-2 type transport system ATP-binding protein